MKKFMNLSFCLWTAGLLLGLAACHAVKDSIRARMLLEQCDYELKEVHVQLLDFSPMASFTGEEDTVDLSKPSMQLASYFQRIVKGDFKLSYEDLAFNAIVEINNPTDHEAIFDSLTFKTYLDETFIVDGKHLEHTVVAPKSKTRTKVVFAVPTGLPDEKALQAKEVTLKGKVWFNCKVSASNSFTLPLPFSVSEEIPKEEILQAINENKQSYIDSFSTWIEKNKSSIKDLFKF